MFLYTQHIEVRLAAITIDNFSTEHSDLDEYYKIRVGGKCFNYFLDFGRG